MGDVIEPALSGRAKCRGCRRRIVKDEPRFGEAVPNPFGDGESTHWFCLACGAEKRPERFEAALAASVLDLSNRDELARTAQISKRHPKLTQIARAERSPTGRARCQHCRENIEKGQLRIALERSDDGMISPAGFVHAECSGEFFGTVEGLLERLRRTSEKLDEASLLELEGALRRGREG